MNIELSEKEFRRLLDMVYIGNWILNSTRGDDRFEDYDLLQEKLFALCPGHGMRSLVETWQGHIFPSRAYEDGGIHEAIADYEAEKLWLGRLIQKLPALLQHLYALFFILVSWAIFAIEDFTQLQERMEEYMDEFDKNGLNTINIDI